MYQTNYLEFCIGLKETKYFASFSQETLSLGTFEKEVDELCRD